MAPRKQTTHFRLLLLIFYSFFHCFVKTLALFCSVNDESEVARLWYKMRKFNGDHTIDLVKMLFAALQSAVAITVVVAYVYIK